MYAEDSFYTLTLFERLGLFCVSAVLLCAILALAALVMRKQGGPARVAIAAVLFMGFVWLSPQVYYGYYQMITVGLPQKSVIGPLPELSTLAGLISFSGLQTIAAHSAGGLFWVLIWVSWYLRLTGSEASGPDP